jgi:hypothetical protein
MTETNSEETGHIKTVSEMIAEESTSEGRYIPWSGGIMGWFENSGVLKCEIPNNYLFYTVMESDTVRSKQFERWGDRFNRRGPRDRKRKSMNITILADGAKVKGATKDISVHGIRLQFLEEVSLEKGQKCTVQIHKGDTAEVLVEMNAKVVWEEKVGRVRTVWNIGVTFLDTSPEQVEALTELVSDEE